MAAAPLGYRARSPHTREPGPWVLWGTVPLLIAPGTLRPEPCAMGLRPPPQRFMGHHLWRSPLAITLGHQRLSPRAGDRATNQIRGIRLDRNRFRLSFNRDGILWKIRPLPPPSLD
ncbi:MAG: hypothetical protein EA001_11215 [Oscillatoriales cyanobacterium]|nr:MAG: hypothetical protein EA001_11215 [Oscillatoriales cyanobacterium]